METNNEIWKPVYLEEFKNLYEVSNKGNVRRKKEKTLLKGSISDQGYHRIFLYNKGYQKTFRVHRLVKITFDPIEDYQNYHVHHRDGNKLNNNLYNLQYITLLEHNELERKKGTSPIGQMGKRSPNFKGLIGMLNKEGFLLNFYEGMYDLQASGYNHRQVYNVINEWLKTYRGYFWKRFSKEYKPEIGKQYDLNDSDDSVFVRISKKSKSVKKKEHQLAFKF